MEAICLGDHGGTHHSCIWESLQGQAERRRSIAPNLRYDLTVALDPMGFQDQLILLDELEGAMPQLPLQLRLERAILYHQCSEHQIAEREFRVIRRILRDQTTDEFILAPRRLYWFRGPDGQPRQCRGTVVESRVGKSWVRVADLQNQIVPFVPQDFGERSLPPGRPLMCRITFGWKGPFATRPAEDGGEA